MKKSDYIYFLVSIISASTFCIVSILQIKTDTILVQEKVESTHSQSEDVLMPQPLRQHRQHRHRRGREMSPTGKPADMEKIRRMIQQGTLSNKEALFYKKFEDTDINEENTKP